ncbi:hypothetical protein [Dyadobacter sp. LHD-138]|uniref:hypothetical protein n=1 Tax=Dyadobacter sp. LHD-138 TaxID=3071413 RepID=UPI0027E17217|nr:hypothetical protein [Dyadobacter sp. LHD-138]MDQ6480217.1 hypothetical protein [Dyadobacter sp. LHD-138]
MISTKYRKTVTYTLLGLVIFFIFCGGVVFPPFHGYYTTDENFVADSGVLLWYGNTPRGLDWPAAPSMLFYFIAFGASCFASIVQNLGSINGLISVFDIFDKEAYQFLADRESFILLGRAFQILAVGLILWQATRIIYKREHFLLTDSARFFLPIVLITSILVLDNMPVLRPEALSGNLFILLMARVLFARSLTSRDIVTASVIFGLILAERLIFAFFVPFFIGAVFLLADKNRFQAVLFSLLVMLLSFIVFCPFIISDTLVVLKSFVGGIIAKLNDKPMGTLFNMEYIGLYFSQPVNYLILVLSGLGIFQLLRTKKTVYYLLLGNMFLFLFLVLRSSLIYDTHVLPAAVVNLFLVGLGLSFVAEKIKVFGPKLALAMIVIIAVTNITASYGYHARVHKKVNMNDAHDWILTLPSGTKMLLNPEFEFFIPKTYNCLLREQEQNMDKQKMIKKINFLLGNKAGMEVNGNDLPIIANAFAFEDERQYDTEYRILLKFTPQEKRKVYDYDIYFDAIELASHSIQTETAFKDFRDGKYEYVVTEKKLDGLEPIKVFDKEWGSPYYVYRGGKK